MEGEESRRLPLTQLSLLALGLGVITGLGAVLFRDLIGLVHNLLFAGQAIVHYDANIFTGPAPWGPLVILVPVLGAVLVTFLVSNSANGNVDVSLPSITLDAPGETIFVALEFDSFTKGGGIVDAADTFTATFSSEAGLTPGSSVPEPATIGLLCLGLAGVGFARRNRRSVRFAQPSPGGHSEGSPGAH